MITSNDKINDNTKYVQEKMIMCKNYNALSFLKAWTLSFFLVHILCYHLCYHLMLSFFVIISHLLCFSWKRDTLFSSHNACRYMASAMSPVSLPNIDAHAAGGVSVQPSTACELLALFMKRCPFFVHDYSSFKYFLKVHKHEIILNFFWT